MIVKFALLLSKGSSSQGALCCCQQSAGQGHFLKGETMELYYEGGKGGRLPVALLHRLLNLQFQAFANQPLVRIMELVRCPEPVLIRTIIGNLGLQMDVFSTHSEIVEVDKKSGRVKEIFFKFPGDAAVYSVRLECIGGPRGYGVDAPLFNRWFDLMIDLEVPICTRVPDQSVLELLQHDDKVAVFGLRR